MNMGIFSSSTRAIPVHDTVPRHIAIIMDGNGRWAKQRFLLRVAGHKRGVEALRKTIQACVDRGVKFLTVFAFSSENWRRPAEEVSVLRKLFMTVLENEVEKMHANGIRLKVIGNLEPFGEPIIKLARNGEQRTAENSQLIFTVAANYGGRWDVIQAMNRAVKANPGLAEFTEDLLEPYLALSHAPEPDLFIRTGGEQRISNFLLWQLAYTELYFTDTLWPDFSAKALDSAIASYCERERRFGRTSEQLEGISGKGMQSGRLESA
jgi:undecaprenyl diphosphate synthase